jgi:4-amino-4-deoxy-L-arabinose transferase-like glycosyltransferase
MVTIIKKNIWLILILLLAIGLRVYRLDYLELFGDELDAGYQSYSILLHAKDYRGNWLPPYMESFSEWRAPGLMYAMVPFIKIFGLNEWGVRMPSVFFGVGSIVGFYWLLIRLKATKKVALWSVLFLAISPWHIQYSRSAFELTLLSAMLVWGMGYLHKGIIEKKNIYVVWSALVFSIAIYTYNTANIYVPLFCLVMLILFKANLKQAFVLIVSGAIICLPLIYQIVFGHAAERFSKVSITNNKEVVALINDYRNADNSSLTSKVFFNKYTVSLRRILFNYSNAFSGDFLFRTGDVTFRHSLHQVGYLYWVMLPLIIIGLLSANKYMVLWLLIAPIPSSLTYDGYNHGSRLFLLVFPLCYLAANGLANVKKKWSVIVGLVLIFEFVFFQYYYWNFYRDESWRWWHTGYKSAMTYVLENKEHYDHVLIDNTYEPALIRYLFWNKIDPKEIMSLVDKGNYCVDKVCFMDFGDKFDINHLDKKTLYLLSQEKNIGGLRDLEKEPPENSEVLKTVRNFYGQSVFYLVRGK